VRVLQFCNYAERIGGAEVYAHALIEALRERGHEVALFGSAPDSEVDQDNLRVVRRPMYERSRLVSDPQVRTALLSTLERFRPDVLHVHNVFSVALDVVDVLARSGVPLLHTVHDYQLLCPNSWCVHGDGTPCPGGAGAHCFQHGCQDNYPYDAWSVLLAQLRQRMLSEATALALAPSTYLVERLRANGWSEARRLPYFIDFTPAPAELVRKQGQLLFAGRLEKEKGIDVLLRAMPKVLEACADARLSIIGGGSSKNSLQALTDSLGLAKSVHFLSSVERSQLAEHYAVSSVAILPSVWTENSPLVAYECLLSGLPMIGSRIGGIPELIEPGCGLTFRPRDPDDLATQLVRFLRSPAAEREGMSKAARARAATFDKQQHLHAIEEAYAEIRARPLPTPGPEIPELFAALAATDQESQAARRTPLLERLRPLARRLRLPKVFGR
jgi:glycosyltransferase involved in cell wall biosynthesis